MCQGCRGSTTVNLQIKTYPNAAPDPSVVSNKIIVSSNLIGIATVRIRVRVWFGSAEYRVYKKRNPTLMLYNSDKQNFHSSILALLFSLIFCLFNEGSLAYFRQITNSAEVTLLPEVVILRFLKICIYNYVVRRKGRNERQFES